MKQSCENCPDCKIAAQQPKLTRCTCSTDHPNIVCGYCHEKAHERTQKKNLTMQRKNSRF